MHAKRQALLVGVLACIACLATLASIGGCSLVTDLGGLAGTSTGDDGGEVTADDGGSSRTDDSATGDGSVTGDGSSAEDGSAAGDGSVTGDGSVAGDAGADGSVTSPSVRLVQSAAGSTQPSMNTLTKSFAPSGDGNLLVVAVALSSSTSVTVTSITDNAPGGGNSYVSANQRSVDGSCADFVEIWFAKNVHAGASTVTVTASGAAQMNLWVLELAGLSTTDPLDTGAVSSNRPSSNVVTAPAVTPSTPSAVVISTATTCGTISTVRAGNPFTGLAVLSGESTAYLITAAAGSYGAVWNASSGTWNASTVAFK
jgi:hypothetical protein